jgi:hypothetical protein
LVLIRLSIQAQTQIPNGNFENWTDQYNAVGWNSINELIHSAVRTPDSNTGGYAASLTTNSIFISNIPGLVTLGIIDIENYTVTGGIPFTDRPTGISYYFKYAPVSNDTSYMLAVLTKWNTINLETDTIGMTAYFTNYSIQTYTKVAVPFVYVSGENPDTLNVIFLSSGFEGHAGSNLKVDDVICEYGTVVSPTLCFPAVNVSSTQFTANWLPLNDASDYHIDVSTNSDFTSYLPGYGDLSTGLDTFCIVDVSPGTYYYRVRVHYDTEVSIHSNTIEVVIESNDLRKLTNDHIIVRTSANQIYIDSPLEPIEKLELYDAVGKCIYSSETPQDYFHLFVLQKGLYIAVMKLGNQVISKKFIVSF